MPTKSKLPRNKVPPPKMIRPQEIQQSTSMTTQSNIEPQKTASGLSQDAEDRFELELCWCIQQLQTGLTDMTLQDKQVYNMTKSLNVLKSNNASLIKKRQVMRNTFGDYRSKMAEDEKKFGKSTSTVKFMSSNKKLDKKSKFFKKACTPINAIDQDNEDKIVSEQSTKRAIINPDVSNEPFKFNFLISEE